MRWRIDRLILKCNSIARFFFLVFIGLESGDRFAGEFYSWVFLVVVAENL